MWDAKRFNAIIEAIKQSGTFLGCDNIKAKEQIYALISKELYVQKDTVKSWARESSTGPGDNTLIAQVEQVLGIQAGMLGRRGEAPVRNEKKQRLFKLTDVNKDAILRSYMVIKDYIHSPDVADEDFFAKMCAEVEKYRIAIPEEIYKAVLECIDKLLAPIVYEPRDTFAMCFSDEIGFWEEEVFHITEETKYCMYYMMKLIDIENSFDTFAMEKLYPLLVGRN